MSKTTTIVKMRSDGRLFRLRADGGEEELSGFAEDHAPYEGVADPDNPPLSPDKLKRLRRVPRVKTLRRALQLTQEEFAECYRIPIGTLRDWEQGRSEPDAPARAYLRVIAADPEGVRKSLRTAVRP
jgi:putative transcriptional regulator